MTNTGTSPIHSHDALLAYIAAGGRPRYLMFWGHQPTSDGRIGPSCFSQWFQAPFVVEDTRYPTAEHFMMAEKARLFGDEANRAQVLASRSPAQAKQLGRQVAGFDETRWNAARFDIVVRGNQAKFSQNTALGDFLRNTGTRVLVEASPVDRIWGIGLAADHDDAQRPQHWRGLNLLGFALMAVRDMPAARP